MTAKIPARGAILGYVTSIIMMTLGIVVLPVVTAPAATAATTCQTPASGAIYRTPGPNQVALTIDDGPSGNWTPQVLNILQSHGVHATFFVIGENVRANPGMIGQILAGGNLVGNHTETHATLTGMSAAGQGQQMDSDTQDIINAGGPAPCFFRAPGGGFDPSTLSQARQRGMSLVQWSNDTLDWAAPLYQDAAYQAGIVSRATNPLYTNPVILMHDGSPGNYRQNTVESLARVIEFYQARGYTFTDPLGNPFTGDNPLGSADVVASPSPGLLHVGGWAFDPDESWTNIQVHIYVNGVGWPITTGNPRPDVQAAYPHYTIPAAGFDFVTQVPAGRDHVTVYAINVGPGSHTVLWDGDVNVASPNPVGSMDFASSPVPGQVRVAGWAFDPDVPTAHIGIHVYVNGVGYPFVTSGSRPDVKAVYPQTISTTGYDITVPAPGGNDHVTVFAINEGLGSHTVLWDGFISVDSPSPIGSLDAVSTVGGPQVRVAGWSFDPSSPTTHIAVHVYINGTGYAISTGDYRPDVLNVYPQTTANQGFIATLPAPLGVDTVCAYGINVGPGDNALLGCKSITVIN